MSNDGTDPLLDRLGNKSVVLVGLMGAGKSCVGIRLAKRIGLPFVDADTEIEKAAGCSIPDIFQLYGEESFRDGERKVIARLLDGGPQVLATGGGAFMNDETREAIEKHGISVWLRADLKTLVTRTARRGNRPLLKNKDPKKVLGDLIDERYPVYGKADITVDTDSDTPTATAKKVQEALRTFLAKYQPAETDA